MKLTQSQVAKNMWAKKTPEERSAHASMMKKKFWAKMTAQERKDYGKALREKVIENKKKNETA